MSVIEVLKKADLQELDFHLTSSTQALANYTQAIDIDNQNEQVFRENLELLGEVKKLLIRLKNGKLDDKKDFILKTINTALSDVFVGQNLRIDIVATNSAQGASKLNLRYDIILYQNDIEINRNEKLMQSNGGGVLSFCSILFKILVGFIYSRNKFFLFDESIAEVSPAYRPRMAQFFRKFCDTHGFTLVLVTQTEDVDEFATLTYRLDGDFEDGISTLKIDKIEGEYPEKNYIYSKIQNFQSIKKLEFRYHGFTVIIGKNNIGKSASFRAVDSILFNSYDHKMYARFADAKNRDKRLNTRIEFGFIGEDGQDHGKKIVLKKKGQSVLYEFDDKEFQGKMLAFDKVKEKIESIGFKYLNLKESYKNFKGTLKDQTERLAVTTQNDGHYLIGNKSNDTAKVFDFLFDTRDITTAILTLDQDIINNENELESARARVFMNKKYYAYELQKVEVIKIIRGQKVIEAIQDLILEVKTEEMAISINQKKLETLNKLISITGLYTQIQNTIHTRGLLDASLKKLTEKHHLIDGIIQIKNKQATINGIFEQNKIVKYFTVRKNYYELYGKTLLISTLQYLKGGVDNLTHLIQFQTKRFNALNNIIDKSYKVNLINELVRIHDHKILLDNRKHRAEIKVIHINNIQQILNKQIALNSLISGIQDNQYFITGANHSVKYNMALVNLYNTNIKIQNYNILMGKISAEVQNISTINNFIHDKLQEKAGLDDKYNLCTCGQCGGQGVVQKH